MPTDKHIIAFLRCPNHKDNTGWGTLRFISPNKIKCFQCKKEFDYEQIVEELRKDYQLKLRDLQVDYSQKYATLAFVHENFGTLTTKIEND